MLSRTNNNNNNNKENAPGNLMIETNALPLSQIANVYWKRNFKKYQSSFANN